MGFDYGALREYWIPWKREPYRDSEWKDEIDKELIRRAVGNYKF